MRLLCNIQTLQLYKTCEVLVIKNRLLLCGLALTALVLLLYYPLTHASFLNYDDIEYVTGNPHVNTGVNAENIWWAFSRFHASNWHPLTWISHMVDVSLFGLHPAGHHVHNLLIHLLNCFLLYAFLFTATQRSLFSGTVALLFAIHPLHLESVAWISERKNLLCTVFMFSALWSYVLYVKGDKKFFYYTALVLFIFSLMAKPMSVTLPFLLLLLDYWPLRRFDMIKTRSRIWLEKLPFLFFTMLSGIITLLAQSHGGAVRSLPEFPMSIRFANALWSYVTYLRKLFVPVDLAIMYPYVGAALTWLHIILAAAVLIVITVVVLWRVRRHPVLAVGWFWFLGTLTPVIGLVQVGTQALADRYAYMTAVGIFMIIAELVTKKRTRSRLIAAIFILWSGWLAFLTRQSAPLWQNSITLFKQAVQVTSHNSLAHINLGAALADEKKYDEAFNHFQQAAHIDSKDASTFNNMGYIRLQQQRYAEAEPFLLRALQMDPHSPAGHNNLGKVYWYQNRVDSAIVHFRQAVALMPNFIEAKENLKFALATVEKKKTDSRQDAEIAKKE